MPDVPPYCHEHRMYHDLRYPSECQRMRDNARRKALAALARERAERIAAQIADEYTDRYAADAYRGDELQMVRGVIEDAATAAALAALTEKENAS